MPRFDFTQQRQGWMQHILIFFVQPLWDIISQGKSPGFQSQSLQARHIVEANSGKHHNAKWDDPASLSWRNWWNAFEGQMPLRTKPENTVASRLQVGHIVHVVERILFAYLKYRTNDDHGEFYAESKSC